MATPMTTGPMRPLDGKESVHQPVAARPVSISGIAQALERNGGLKLISVALAIGLWVFVNAGQHGSLESFQVPISYRDLPPGYAITNQHPEFVHIQVSGPRTLLSLIDPTHLVLRLDLNGVGIGQASFKLSPDAFPVPRQTTVTSILPSQIVLEIDKNVSREVPIHVTTTGLPAEGYKVASIEIDPKTVAVRGPSRNVARIDDVETEPLSLDGISGDITRSVDLMTPSSMVRLESDQVTAKVILAPVITNREFRELPVQVRDAEFRFRVDPLHVRLVLRGPLRSLARIDLKNAVYVEADGLTPGSYILPVQINLPDDVALVHQSPDKVKVRMYREKQVRRG